MAKLIMWNLITLDGYFEGDRSWEIDWHVWGEEIEQLSIRQLKSAGMLLFGRVTYLGMAQYWTTAKGEVADLMNGISKAVFSTTLDKADWNNTRLIKRNAEIEVESLKASSGRDLFVFGSADLSANLMKANLFDEYRLCVNPIVLGRGNPLFKDIAGQRKMKLIEVKPLKLGSVILYYQPA